MIVVELRFLHLHEQPLQTCSNNRMHAGARSDHLCQSPPTPKTYPEGLNRGLQYGVIP